MNWRRSLVTFNAALALISFGFGATLTSARLRAQLDSGHAALAESRLLQAGHQHSAYLLLVLLLIAPAVCWKTANRAQRILFLTAAAGAIVSALLSAGMVIASYRAMLHAFFGEIVTGCCIAIACLHSRRDHARFPEHRASPGGLPLRTLAAWLLPLVLSQIAMGALYRHGQWSVLPHMAGALFVAATLVAMSVVLLQQAAEHPALSAVARFALGFVLLQVVLGIFDFLLRLLDFQDTDVWIPLSVAHVINASLLLAAAICESTAVLAFVREDRDFGSVRHSKPALSRRLADERPVEQVALNPVDRSTRSNGPL